MSASADEVREFHTKADTDGSDGSIHHTLGPRKGQASPGDHDHRGGSSIAILDGVTISGDTPTDAINSIIAALVELGAEDSTDLPAAREPDVPTALPTPPFPEANPDA